MGAVLLAAALAVLLKFTFFSKKADSKHERTLDSIQTPADMLAVLRHQIAQVQTLSLGTAEHQGALHQLILLLNQAKIHFPGELEPLSKLVLDFKAVPPGSDGYVAPLLQTHGWIQNQARLNPKT